MQDQEIPRGISARRSNAAATAALIATAILWGTNHVIARAVHEVVPLPALVFWRWFPAAVVLSFLSIPVLRKAWPEISARAGELVIGGIVGVGVFSYALLGGAFQSLAIEVGFINATTPVWVLLLDRRRGGSRFNSFQKAGLVLGFAGTLVIITKGNLNSLSAVGLSIGNVWSLAAAISFAWFTVQARRWSNTIPPLAITVVSAWSGLLFVMLPAYLIWGMWFGPWMVWNPEDQRFAMMAVAYIGFGPTMLGNLFYIFGVGKVGPARAAAYLYVSPLCSAALSIMLLGEQLAAFHVVSIAMILSGMVMAGRSTADGS